MVSFWEHGNEHSRSTKGENFWIRGISVDFQKTDLYKVVS